MRAWLAAMLGSVACAASAAPAVELPARLAFSPRLVRGADLPECQALRSAYETAFRAPGEFDPWATLPQAEPGQVEDFDGDGRAERLHRVTSTTSGSYEAFTLFAIDTAVPVPARPWDVPESAPRIAPASDGEIALGMRAGEWSYMPLRIVHASGPWLSIEATQWSGPESYGPVRAFGFDAGHRMRLRCEIALRDARGRAPETRLEQPIRKTLDALLAEITGVEGECGSGRFHSGNVRDRELAVRRGLVRPWGPSLHLRENRFDTVLARWRDDGPGHAETAARLPPAVDAWREALARLYACEFGVGADTARRWAIAAVDEKLSEGFAAPDYVDPRRARRDALMRGVAGATSRDDIVAAMADWRAASDAHEPLPADPWHAAVENPVALRPLLAHGYDIDLGNEFGKTALMYAAQYDALDVTETLLSLGADPAKATLQPLNRCRYTLSTTQVTALHYAVRYASEPLIELLVAAGAPLEAADTSGRTPRAWLDEYGATNPMLDDAARKRIATMLQPLR